MSWPFACEVTGGGRGLLVSHGSAAVAEFAFGLPGEPVAGWVPTGGDARITVTDGFSARLRHTPDDAGWTTVVSVDNTSDAPRALPPLGVAVTVANGWAGWSWAGDVEGFCTIAPADGPGDTLLVRVRRGLWRAAASVPAFAPADRRGDGLGPGVAAFHLADPEGTLPAHGRHATTLEFSAVATPDAAADTLPSWLPRLVLAGGEEAHLRTPDHGIVPGDGVGMTTLDGGVLLTGSPGHRRVAVHGVRGVHRLCVTWTPPVATLLGEMAGELLRRRPSATASASAAVVAAALARRAVPDAAAALDWLERVDWPARGDLWGPAVAGVVASETHDADLVGDACDALLAAPHRPGAGIVGMRLWLATLRAGLAPLDWSRVLGRAGRDGLAGLESALLRNADAATFGPAVTGLTHRLGASLPGQPVGLPEADAGLAVALLRHVPEGWPQRQAATAAAEKAAALLLADHADRLHPAHDGLTWVLMGGIDA